MPVGKQFKFNFKSRAIKGEDGNVIGRTKKQPSILVDLPVYSADELIQILSTDSKEADLICSAVAEMVYVAARGQFDEVIENFGDSDQEVTVSHLDYAKLTLEYLANVPASQRASSALTEEDWVAFFEDYMAVMVAVTGKDAKRIGNHIELFKKPAKSKANKPVLSLLIDQLDIYMASTSNIEETGECAGRIRAKFDKWVSEPEKAVDLSVL